MKHLRNVGFGKTEMEQEIQNAMYGVLDYIKINNNKSISPKRPLAIAVMNVLWKYVAGMPLFHYLKPLLKTYTYFQIGHGCKEKLVSFLDLVNVPGLYAIGNFINIVLKFVHQSMLTLKLIF